MSGVAPERDEGEEELPISYGDMRITSDRRIGPCLFWVNRHFTASCGSLPVWLRLACRWFPTCPPASTCRRSTHSSSPTGRRLRARCPPPNPPQLEPDAPLAPPEVSPQRRPTRGRRPIMRTALCQPPCGHAACPVAAAAPRACDSSGPSFFPSRCRGAPWDWFTRWTHASRAGHARCAGSGPQPSGRAPCAATHARRRGSRPQAAAAPEVKSLRRRSGAEAAGCPGCGRSQGWSGRRPALSSRPSSRSFAGARALTSGTGRRLALSVSFGCSSRLRCPCVRLVSDGLRTCLCNILIDRVRLTRSLRYRIDHLVNRL